MLVYYSYQKNKKSSDKITYPNLEDGLEGIVFVDACIQSAKNNCQWITLKKIKFFFNYLSFLEVLNTGAAASNDLV